MSEPQQFVIHVRATPERVQELVELLRAEGHVDAYAEIGPHKPKGSW